MMLSLYTQGKLSLKQMAQLAVYVSWCYKEC